MNGGYDGIAHQFIGLDYFGARYFSGAAGRFTSADEPLLDQDPIDPQSWNLYVYGRNNPLRFVDPTGNYVFDSAASEDEKKRFREQLALAQTAANMIRDKYGEKSKQYTSAARANASYGAEGVANGVTVAFGAPKTVGSGLRLRWAGDGNARGDAGDAGIHPAEWQSDRDRAIEDGGEGTGVATRERKIRRGGRRLRESRRCEMGIPVWRSGRRGASWWVVWAAVWCGLAAESRGQPPGQTAVRVRQNQLLRIGSQPPDWQAALQAHGDRLLSPGKERKVWTGTISRRGAAARPFQLTGELPNLMRFQEQGGATVVFDGAAYGRGAGGVQKEDADLVETLGYDCPEAFLYAIANQWPVRKLGTRFRMDGQVKTRYTGAVYDVFTIMAPVQQAGRVKRQAKYYLVNSDTNLLERVRYVDADNPGTKVEVFLEHWGAVSKNRVPGTIRRVENGTEVLRLNVAAAALGRAMADDAFVKP